MKILLNLYNFTMRRKYKYEPFGPWALLPPSQVTLTLPTSTEDDNQGGNYPGKAGKGWSSRRAAVGRTSGGSVLPLVLVGYILHHALHGKPKAVVDRGPGSDGVWSAKASMSKWMLVLSSRPP